MKDGLKNLIKIYVQPTFLICAAVLAFAGGGMSIAVKSFGIYLRKEPLPLKRSFDLMDEGSLVPYKVLSKSKIENDEVVKSLGTEDYIQWNLEDTAVPPESSVRYCMLLITYYGFPDVILHVPEECYVGGGYQKLSSDNVEMEVNKNGVADKITVKYLTFGSIESTGQWQTEVKFPVMYIFKVNGEYGSSREDTQLIMGKNIRGKHSYFCKIEWKFFNTKSGSIVYPDKEEAVTESRKLLGVVLPVLEKDHLPDWKN
jgi:hypothetical protein